MFPFRRMLNGLCPDHVHANVKNALPEMSPGLYESAVISVAPVSSFAPLAPIERLPEPSLKVLHRRRNFRAAASPYQKVYMVGRDGVVQNIYLEAPGGLPEKVEINISVPRELQQEFPPMASVGYMVARMIQKSPSSSRHRHFSVFGFKKNMHS